MYSKLVYYTYHLKCIACAMRKVFAVTINYNTEEDTNALLKSLEKADTSGFNLDVIVVDNASKNPFILSSKEKHEHILVIRSESNTGFSGGNNIGIKEALK